MRNKSISKRLTKGAVVHQLLILLLPLGLLALRKAEFIPLGLGLVLLAKWRTFAVKPRYWWANLRANSVDMMTGFAVVVFMHQTNSFGWWVLWAVAYTAWLRAF
jgi:hypothetical protein